MKVKLVELRQIIRKLILESDDEYEDTVLPGEEANKELLGEPDLENEEERQDYVRQKKRNPKEKLQSAEETDGSMGDEHAIVGFVGPAWGDQSGNGPGEKPYKQRVLKPKNAMGPKSVREALNSIK